MAGYQSRKIKGWRSVLDEAITEVRDRFWNAPSHTVHIDGAEAPGADDLIDHVRWFKRIFGPERAIASAELKQLQRVKRKIRYAEQIEGRTGEQTEEQREMRRVKDHERYLLRRAKQSPEDRQEQYAKVRAKRAAQTEAEREHERAMCRRWRTRQGGEWRAKEAEKKRLRRLAKPELYEAIERRSKARTKDARNERRRLGYKANPEVHRARKRSYYAANRERIRAKAKAAYAKQKSSKL